MKQNHGSIPFLLTLTRENNPTNLIHPSGSRLLLTNTLRIEVSTDDLLTYFSLHMNLIGVFVVVVVIFSEITLLKIHVFSEIKTNQIPGEDKTI